MSVCGQIIKQLETDNRLLRCQVQGQHEASLQTIGAYQAEIEWLRESLERISINGHDCGGCALDVSIAKTALERKSK